MEDEIVKSGIKFAIARDATMPLAKALDEIGRLETKHA